VRCLELLATNQRGVGRLALVEADALTILTVNYALVEDRIVFRTAHGSRFGAPGAARSVAFEIDHVDAATRTGWSVVVRGDAEVVTSKGQLFHLAATPLQAWGADPDRWVMIHPDTITGRRVPPGVPFQL